LRLTIKTQHPRSGFAFTFDLRRRQSMTIRKLVLALSSICLLSSCTTLDKSFQLGGILGATTGAVATYAGSSAGGGSANSQEVAIGSGIGFAVGLLTSYWIHESVVSERADEAADTELYFGDLPPSPFILPQKKPKKGGSR
jgi:hypothetical protein